MSNTPTREEVLAMIVPKSDQLNTENLLTGSITVTVEGVRLTGEDKQPMAIDITGHRPFKPCLTCRRVLVKLWTDDAETWIGKQMTLFADPEVILKGHTVGGIRISHLSDISETARLSLPESRNRKKDVVIQPLAAPKPPEPTEKERLYIDEITNMIAAVTTLEELANLGVMMADKSAPIKEALRGLYGARKAELQSKVLEPGG